MLCLRQATTEYPHKLLDQLVKERAGYPAKRPTFYRVSGGCQPLIFVYIQLLRLAHNKLNPLHTLDVAARRYVIIDDSPSEGKKKPPIEPIGAFGDKPWR
jgi:hypothetical protein